MFIFVLYSVANLPPPLKTALRPDHFSKADYDPEYSTIDNVLTSLLPASFHDFFQVLKVSNATTSVNKLLVYSPDGIVYCV